MSFGNFGIDFRLSFALERWWEGYQGKKKLVAGQGFGRPVPLREAKYEVIFTPLEIMPRCSEVPFGAGLHFREIPAGSNAPLGFES